MKLVLALLLTSTSAFVAPAAKSAASSRVNAEAAEAPAAPAYPTVNGWTADPSKFCAGLPGALAPVGDFDPANLLEGRDVRGVKISVEITIFDRVFATVPRASRNRPGLFTFTEPLISTQVKMLREAEVTHGRVSMLAFVGFLVQESGFHPLFNLDGKGIGPAILHLTEVRTQAPVFFEILTLIIGAAEIKRALSGWTAPKKTWTAINSDLPDDSPWSRLNDDYYPGDVGFDPAGLKPTDAKEFADIATKELQNGRLAMIAVAGFFAQELVNGLPILPLQF